MSNMSISRIKLLLLNLLWLAAFSPLAHGISVHRLGKKGGETPGKVEKKKVAETPEKGEDEKVAETLGKGDEKAEETPVKGDEKAIQRGIFWCF